MTIAAQIHKVDPVGAPLTLVQTRPMPSSIETEQALLGACLINGDAFDLATPIVGADDFFDPVHARIWSVIGDARANGHVMTATLLRSSIGDEAGALIEPGKTLGWYISQLIAEATTVIGAQDYARSIRHLADCRRIIAAAHEASDMAYRGMSIQPAVVATGAIQALDAMVTAGVAESARAIDIGEATEAALDRCEKIADRLIKPFDISWGLRSLNLKTNGIEVGDLIIVGGRPSVGKTTFGEAVALEMAKAGTGVYFVSLEMTAQQLGQRALAWRVYGLAKPAVTYLNIRAGNVNMDQRETLRAANHYVRGLPIVVEQEGGLTIGQITTRARRHKLAMERAGTPMKVMVVDHLGIIRPSDRYKGNRVQEVTEFTGTLKALAKELDIAIIALCQLNRGNESLEDKRPTQSAFRDSGSIEQDADMLIGLYRESYYLERKSVLTPEETQLLVDVQNVMEVIFLKQRQGPTGTVRVFCSMPCNHIEDLQN